LILAASSACEALAAAGVAADIIITSDGGNWARFHLFQAVRSARKRAKKPLIVATLNAALLSECAEFPLLAISDGTAENEALLRAIPHISVPARGTVSATALEFALAWTSGRVFVSGLDLANHDIAAHARPYALDAPAWEAASRLRPFYGAQFERSRALDAAGSFSVYRDWFKTACPWYRRQSAVPSETNLSSGHAEGISSGTADSPRVFLLRDENQPWTVN
jgi:hypothetical protein